MNVVQVGIIGVLGALLAVQFKGGKTEYGVYMSVAAGIFLFVCIIDRLEIFISTVEQISSYINMDAGYLATMLKMIGITYIAEFSSGICKDAGYQTIASQIEIFSKLTILALGMPVLLALLETIREFLACCFFCPGAGRLLPLRRRMLPGAGRRAEKIRRPGS